MTYHDHPEYRSLFAAVVADLEDDTPRLVLADWIEEHGDGDRAGIIRVQCELARWRKDDASYSLSPAGITRHTELRRQETALLAAHRLSWLPTPLMAIESDSAAAVFAFVRGFPWEVRVPLSTFMYCGRSVFAACPTLGSVVLTDPVPRAIPDRPRVGWTSIARHLLPREPHEIPATIYYFLKDYFRRPGEKPDPLVGYKWYDTTALAHADLNAACAMYLRSPEIPRTPPDWKTTLPPGSVWPHLAATDPVSPV